MSSSLTLAIIGTLRAAQQAAVAAGVNWVQRASAARSDWAAIAFGGGAFVAVTDPGTATADFRALSAKSTDGITWSQQATLPFAGGFSKIAYGNGVFVGIAGGSTVCATSADGVTWTRRKMPFKANWSSVVFGNGVFVVSAGNFDTVAVSSDGINWVTHALPRPAGANPNTVPWGTLAFGNGVFVLTAGNFAGSGYTDFIGVHSTDGITWTFTSAVSAATGGSIAFGNGSFVTLSSTSGDAWTSPDGANWTQQGVIAVTTIAGFGAGSFIGYIQSGSNLYFATSPDGLTWTQRTLSPVAAGFDIAFGNAMFAGCANDSSISVSSSAGVVPANILVTYNLPNATLSTGYTGSITAANMNGAAGTITVTPGTLPAGLTLGTATDNGNGSWTWPITGTPTAAGAFNVAFSFSNGTQSASYDWINEVYNPSIGFTYDLPTPVLNVAYNGSVTAANVDDATALFDTINFTLTGSLPTGLSAGGPAPNGDGSWTLPISGTPTTSGQTISVQFNASNGTHSGSYWWHSGTVAAAAPIVFTTSLPQPQLGVAYTGSITAANANGATGTITIAASNLPDGITAGTLVNNGNGSWTLPLSGTPTVPSTFTAFSAAFSATNGTQTADYAWDASVAANPMTLTGTLPSSANVGSVYHGALTLGGYFNTPLRIGAVAGVIPAWMTVTISGTTLSFDGTPTTQETESFTPSVADVNTQTATGTAQSITVGASISPSVSISTSLPQPKVGVAYSGSVTGTNQNGATGTITYSVNTLPAGLSLNTTSGAVTGTPTTSGAFTSVFTATNGTQSAQYTWSGSVAANPLTLTGTLPNATVGVAYSGHLTLGGAFTAPVTIGASVGSIPAWMTVTVTGTDVAFTGTPAAGDVATDTFTVRATDNTTPTAQVATSAQSVVVSAAATAPVFVQINSAHAASGTSLPVTLNTAPTSGNLLVAAFLGNGTINTPAGWTAAGTNSGMARFQTFSKISDGSETATTFTCSGSGNMGATVVEWKGAKIGTFTSGTASLASRTATFGSTDAPIGANSMPMMFLNGTCNYQISLTYSSPWMGQQVPNVAGTYNEPYSCYQTTGPNAAVSGTVTAGNTQTYLAPYWNHVWIDPA